MNTDTTGGEGMSREWGEGPWRDKDTCITHVLVNKEDKKVIGINITQ